MSTTERVIELVRETLGEDEGASIRAEQLLFTDLGFTSMDLLDLLFRIEEHFGIQIPEGTLYRLARADMDEADFCVRKVLTPAGRERLAALLFDTPAEVFPERIHADTLPRYCTVGAFVRLVDHQLASLPACSS